MEAYKASIGLRVMVDKLKAHQASRQQQQGNVSNSTQQRFPPQALGFGMFPGGNMADFGKTDDDLAPEQSAAMTLGMLSSGGMSPNFSMGGGAGLGASGPNTGGQTMTAADTNKGAFPASMAGLLNEPMQSERTGLTPQFSGPETSGMGMSGAASPFTQMFGTGGGFASMDGLGADIDWGAWDSYIQGTGTNTMDPNMSIWPMNLDLSQMDQMPQQGQPQQQQPQQGQSGSGASGSGPGSVFMGSSGGTPNMM